MNLLLLKRPSAFLPVVMSLAALAMLLGYMGYAALFHIKPEPAADEGVLAHLFQLLLAGQVPIAVFFAITWLPRAPRQAVTVLLLQAGAAFAAMAPVFFLVQEAYEPGRSGVTPPGVVRQVQADYTESAKSARIEGDVVMWAVVRADGTVGDVVVQKSVDRINGLDTQAVKALKQWQFTPGTKDGKPVPVRISVKTTFALK